MTKNNSNETANVQTFTIEPLENRDATCTTCTRTRW